MGKCGHIARIKIWVVWPYCKDKAGNISAQCWAGLKEGYGWCGRIARIKQVILVHNAGLVSRKDMGGVAILQG